MSLFLQVAASITTIVGMWLGSTERWGSVWYGISMIFWWALMVHAELWGLAPLNAAVNSAASPGFALRSPASSARRSPGGGSRRSWMMVAIGFPSIRSVRRSRSIVGGPMAATA